MYIPGPQAKHTESDSLEGSVNSSVDLDGHRSWVISRGINRFDGIPPYLPLSLKKAVCKWDVLTEKKHYFEIANPLISWTKAADRGRDRHGGWKEQCSVTHLEYVSAMFLQHRALMEELNRSKKDFEAIIQAKNKELEQTKVLERRWRFRIWLAHATQHFPQCKGWYGEWRERLWLFPSSRDIICKIS